MVNLAPIKQRVSQLQNTCEQLDHQLSKKLNGKFHFNRALFSQHHDSLTGYALEVSRSLQLIEENQAKGVTEAKISHMCETLVDQFTALNKLVSQTQQGNGALFSHKPSQVEKALYHKLHKQYEYEQRLGAMIEQSQVKIQALYGTARNHEQTQLDTLKQRLQRCQAATRDVERKVREYEASSEYIGNF
ncbi:primosomal replication protein PriC [Motilimonas pumila]|uniref:Primosomal replication protein N n=1 Tax=Motilimonas pumila TaxID=2303987 RepID=A0A418YCH1_9GAMM|nr:primosomal replication protein PriC [Motilimonas pumila]RJG42224.1 hypothetical protein D1Z90_14060 [Motilimonas pumila]